ncbi:tRNA-dihydrouridine synthase family protein [uncultured Clostridium sp.]|jgi:tRNA-dihydrouridine synthase|uniref:tRNA dihydrouridine synthase n=1 Tax=uncultured Clostridium sp. TaxID=59620 RepID=UPI002601B778|nr:tRNA-dihydrouridine synthase family protein [uncultured Clostridium sp.]
MKYYLAPLEGITGYIYRNAYKKVFGDIDKYFAPFIVPNQSNKFKTKELRDLLPENNVGINLVPQVLTNNAEGFIFTAEKLKSMGYDEININLGCPSGTVVSKGRGSGFLAYPEDLDRFLDEIFKIDDMKISIKTRLGKDEPDEFYELMRIYNQYPMEELIIHLRTRQDFYKNKPNLEMYRHALEVSTNPVCYNGDIFCTQDDKKIIEQFPETDRIMLGRGIISNPGIMGEIKHNRPLTKEKVKEFHDELLSGYTELFKNDQRVILFKMKEVWAYMNWVFSEHTKYAKNIRKSQDIVGYKRAVEALFREQDVVAGASLFKERI